MTGLKAPLVCIYIWTGWVYSTPKNLDDLAEFILNSSQKMIETYAVVTIYWPIIKEQTQAK